VPTVAVNLPDNAVRPRTAAELFLLARKIMDALGEQNEWRSLLETLYDPQAAA